MRQDNDISALDMIRSCDDLKYPLTPYSEAQFLCKNNGDADLACPENSYQVLMVPDLNEDDEKDTAFKVCGLCPAGECARDWCTVGWSGMRWQLIEEAVAR